MLKVKEAERLRIDEIFQKEEYLKTRRIEYFKNKTGFYDFKTF